MSTRQSLMSERSEGTTIYQSSPHASITSPRISHNPLPREGERLSFNMDETFRGLDEFHEDPSLFLEENSWDGEESELSDPTLTLLNQEHFQVRSLSIHCFIVKPPCTVYQSVLIIIKWGLLKPEQKPRDKKLLSKILKNVSSMSLINIEQEVIAILIHKPAHEHKCF